MPDGFIAAHALLVVSDMPHRRNFGAQGFMDESHQTNKGRAGDPFVVDQAGIAEGAHESLNEIQILWARQRQEGHLNALQVAIAFEELQSHLSRDVANPRSGAFKKVDYVGGQRLVRIVWQG